MDHDRKWPFTVDLPINNGDFPLLFVRLPEGQSMKVWGEFFYQPSWRWNHEKGMISMIWR